MLRAIKLSLNFATRSKRRKINALVEHYRSAVNFYIKYLWVNKGKLDKETLECLQTTRLSERYKSNALKQALGIVDATKASTKALKKRNTKCPVFKGSIVLDKKFITIEDGEKSFDLVLRLSTLKKGKRITIPTKKTKVLNKWLAKEGAVLKQGCALSEDKLIIWVDIPEALQKTEGKELGLDLGINKLISDSDGNFYGTEMKKIMSKISRKKPGSKNRKKACEERKNYIGRVLNELPWESLKTIGVENLKNIKKGKRKNRSKSFRKFLSPWVASQVLTRIKFKAEENRVLFCSIDPKYTSQCCSECGTVDSNNRKGEDFLCTSCNHKEDADTNGAKNILAKTLQLIGSLESPMNQK